MEDAIAKELRETSMKPLLAMFEQLLASVSGSFSDREATMRFKRSGQRWFEEGLSPCLQLGALRLNTRLRPCFDLVVAAHSATLAAA